MQVTNKIKMDLTRPDPTLTVHAVQGEVCSRSLQISLYRGHEAWTVPADVTVTVRYAKPDRTKGCYDTLPNGTSAWSAQGNLLTVHLAPQMLTVPGSVKAQIQLIQGPRILSTFALTLFVEADPAAGTMRSENYINWLQWIEDQAQDQVKLTQQAANTACQASEAAALAADNAANSSNQAASFVSDANTAATQAQKAAEDAAAAQKESEDIAGTVSAIVAGNEAYTKEESHHLFSPAIIAAASGETITLTDSTDLKLQGLKLFGKTLQNGIPSPENPVPLFCLGSSGRMTISIGKGGDDTKLQTITASIPYGLSGIPVSNSGNYTDETGQQWICDEVDFSRGIYIQRTKKKRVLSSLNWIYSSGTNRFLAVDLEYKKKDATSVLEALCSHFQANKNNRLDDLEMTYINDTSSGFAYRYDALNGDIDAWKAFLDANEVYIVAELSQQIETALTEDITSAYAVLQTCYPNTIVTNDCGAGMTIRYGADTSLYIDNRIRSFLH